MRNMSNLNIAFDRYASTGTVMHYILVCNPDNHFIRTLDNLDNHLIGHNL